MNNVFTLKKSLNNKYAFLGFVVLLYLLRFAFLYSGYLQYAPWLSNGDVSHIYLIGLDSYLTGEYPYFGGDVVYTKTMLPGGLQGLLIAFPLYICSHPFSPYFLVFLISTCAFIYLSYYCTLLYKNLSLYFIYAFIAFLPFGINTGMNVINPAYLISLCVPFFLSILEILNIYPIKKIHPIARFFWIGFTLGCGIQLNTSVIFLVFSTGIFLIIVFIKKYYTIKQWLQYGVVLLVSFLIGVVSLIPTLYHYGTEVLFSQKESLFFSLTKLGNVFPAVFDFWFLSGYDVNKVDKENSFKLLLKNKHYISLLLFLSLQIIGYVILVTTMIWVIIKRKVFFVNNTRKFSWFLFVLLIMYIFILMFSKEKHRFHYLHPFFALSVLWMFHIFSSIQEKFHIKYIPILSWFVILFCYYTCMLYVNKQNKYPHYFYREKAFKSLQKKDASLFETYRYLDYKNQPKKR